MSISGNGVSRFAQLAARSPTGPRRWLRTAPKVGAVNKMMVPAGTTPVSDWLNVTDVAVVAVTVVPEGIPLALADIPVSTPAADVKDSTVSPTAAGATVISERGAATTASQRESSETVSMSCRYAIGPRGEAQGAGMQSVSAPSGLTGLNPPGGGVWD